MAQAAKPIQSGPDPLSRVGRLLGSLRLAVTLLVLIAAASVVGIVLPQAESFKFEDYIHTRLDPGSESAMSAEEFLRLARAGGVDIGHESLAGFLQRAKDGKFTQHERAHLFPQAVVPPADAQKMKDHEWRRVYADFVRRAAKGQLTEKERERLAFAAFVDLAGTRKVDSACLRLAYADSYGRLLGGLLTRLGMHRTFRSFWFRALCVLLVVNLVVCSCRRIPGQWRAAFGTRGGGEPGWYTKRGTHASINSAAPVDEAAARLGRVLRARGFRVALRAGAQGTRIEGDRGWLGALGRLWWPLGALAGAGRFGSCVVHLGVVLVILGGFVSGRLSFRHAQWAAPGDVIAVPAPAEKAALAPDWRVDKGKKRSESTQFRLRVDRFDVKFDSRGKPEHYRCSVTVLDTEPPLTHVIEVNHPLVYRGYYAYQNSMRDDYSRLGSVDLIVEKVRRSSEPDRGHPAHGAREPVEVLSRVAVVAEEGKDVAVPGADLTVRVLRYFPHWQIPLRRLPDGGVAAGEAQNLSAEPRNPAVEVRFAAPGLEPKVRWMPLQPPHGRTRQPFSVDYGDFRVTATSFEPVHITGLSFKTHPVLWPVWVGCGVMMLGICLCFYCNHERVWALVREREGGGSELFLAGSAFKWRERFRERFDALTAALDDEK